MKKIINWIKERYEVEGIFLGWLPGLNISQKKNDLRAFKRYVEKSKWKKEHIENREIWICEDDNTFQIHLAEGWKDFSEDWTNVYPNKKAYSQLVFLKIGNVTVKQLHFIFCDETRIFVPIPKRVSFDPETSKSVYEWNKSSLEYKVCMIIGQYYIYKNLEGVAKSSKINIV